MEIGNHVQGNTKILELEGLVGSAIHLDWSIHILSAQFPAVNIKNARKWQPATADHNLASTCEEFEPFCLSVPDTS